jgi:hypothetical protein
VTAAVRQIDATTNGTARAHRALLISGSFPLARLPKFCEFRAEPNTESAGEQDICIQEEFQ